MGRRVAVPNLESRVRVVRLAVGISQQELADRIGLTRQAVSAIEGGRYIPNTAVALRIAQVLGCRVEDLFVSPERLITRPVDLVGSQIPATRRLALAEVRGRWIGYPLAEGREIQEGFIGADGLLVERGEGVQSALLTDPKYLERTALLLGCDPGLGILCAHVARRSSEARVLWLSAASRTALEALAGGEAHIAGSHLRDSQSGEFNVPHAGQALARTGGSVITFARWEQGFVVQPGNPRSVRTVADLARADVRLINREPGAGSRSLLDDLLGRAGVPAAAVSGYDRVVTSHLAVARTVATGGADVGVALRATAQALGLDFVPLTEVRFDFIIPHDLLDHPAVALVCDVLQSRALRSELATLPGYDVAQMGATVARIPAAA